jgi:hypothetical protein
LQDDDPEVTQVFDFFLQTAAGHNLDSKQTYFFPFTFLFAMLLPVSGAGKFRARRRFRTDAHFFLRAATVPARFFAPGRKAHRVCEKKLFPAALTNCAASHALGASCKASWQTKKPLPCAFAAGIW